MTNIHSAIKHLVYYAEYNDLIDSEDIPYCLNKIADLLELDTFIDCPLNETYKVDLPTDLIAPIVEYASDYNLLAYDSLVQRDLFEAKVMDVVLKRPSEINRLFASKESVSSKTATTFFYQLSQQSNYIKTDRVKKNITWQSNTPYGAFDMTINLSKPEKDPKDIINQQSVKKEGHIQCLLCKENVGYNGALTNVGRTSHRIIPIQLNNEPFYFQYSPYVYYNEHSIVLHKHHVPMNVSEDTFKRLFDFVDRFPHYFLGSNAGLPIVGGSILAHEHYQGGRHTFPIESAKVLDTYSKNGVKIEKLYWPLSVLRLSSTNREALEQVAIKLYNYWKTYSDETSQILAKTDAFHNAITPIARKKQNRYELDITLRNNRTNETYPDGIFHPHPSHHHIKKENIGLIEVMGLAVLPARLEQELATIKACLLKQSDLPKGYDRFKTWYQTLRKRSIEDIDKMIETEVTREFMYCLEDAGVFKQTDQSQARFDQFIRGFIND